MTAAHVHLLLNHIPILGGIFGLLVLSYGILRKSDERVEALNDTLAPIRTASQYPFSPIDFSWWLQLLKNRRVELRESLRNLICPTDVTSVIRFVASAPVSCKYPASKISHKY